MTGPAKFDRADDLKSVRGWFVTVLVMVVVIGTALWWRTKPKAEDYLPRTRALISQKTDSLEAYNDVIPKQELLQFYQSQLQGRSVAPDAFTRMSELVIERVLPELWKAGQDAATGKAASAEKAAGTAANDPFISHRAMASAIQQQFPQVLLVNGDVVLFPEDQQLRVVVSEPPQDFFRDTGWHWRWIGLYLRDRSIAELRELNELDIYAAEELSEFLSVLGVALVTLADRLDDASEAPIDAVDVQAAYGRIRDRKASSQAQVSPPVIAYSRETKAKLLAAIPDPMFREITKQLNVGFIHRPNQVLWRRREQLETPLGIAGGGVSAADFNGDGFVDLYFAGDDGGMLYQSAGGQQFNDVTESNGLAREGESRAGYFIDYDNDGDLDLYITFVARSNCLYQNDGNGHFVDVTTESGLTSGSEITHEAVWFDMDNDGLLDLYAANFGNWAEGAVPTMGRHNANAGPNFLYRHRLVDGKHVFEEVGNDLNVDDRGWTHCVGAWDFDEDGYLDLCSLNDFGASLVYRNVEGQRFVEMSRALHLDATYNAMSYTLIDLDHSGQPSIYVSQMMKLVHRQRYRKPTEQTEIVFSAKNLENLRVLVANRLYRPRPNGVYDDVHDRYLEPADLGWAWDASTWDYENDGDLDLLVLNGTESRIPSLASEERKIFKNQRAFLAQFANERNVCFVSENGYFYDVSDYCPLAYMGNSRGSAMFDLDGDGDLDVAINDYNGPAKIFENLQNSSNHWIRFKLVGTRSNRDAIGAKVEIWLGDQRRFDQVVSGSGFLSQNPKTLHFGLGSAEQVDKIIVTWPSGQIQEQSDLAADRLHTIQESLSE